MREFIQPAQGHVIALVHYFSNVRTMIIKHRAYAIATAVVFFVAVLAAILAFKDMAANAETTHTSITTSSQQTKDAVSDSEDSDNEHTISGGTGAMNASQQNESATSSQSGANVTVNNQQIPVPENGSVSKTVQNEDGSTVVNVTSNNTSNGDSESSSSTSTSLHVSTSTNNHSTSVHIDRSTTY